MFESFPSPHSYEKPESEKRDSKAFSERDPSSDRSIDLLQVEEIAEAQGEISAKLFLESAPSAEWQRVVGDVLAKHPRLREYEPFFENVVGAALERHDALEELWEKSGASASDLPAKRINTGLIEADQPSAKQLFRAMFDSEAKGDVEATKGKLSLTFVMGEEDARSIHDRRATSGQLLEETPFGFALPGGEVPTIVINRDRRAPQAEYVTTVHESEHIRNAILRDGRYRTFGEIIESPGSEATLEKAARREQEGLPIEELAKDELLAQLTYLQILEGSRGVNPELDEKFYEVIPDVASQMKALADPNGHYLRSFEERTQATNQEKERCEQSITRGIDAYVRLWRLQKVSGSRKDNRSNVFRKVSDILEQFPLHEWPAVARLFERQHRADSRKN